MSHTELLFRNLQNGVPISYEKFKAAGWDTDDYLEYLKICEEIRFFCICDEALNYVPGIKNLELVKTRYFYELVDRLSTFLSKFFGRQYDVSFERGEFDIYENWTRQPAAEAALKKWHRIPKGRELTKRAAGSCSFYPGSAAFSR